MKGSGKYIPQAGLNALPYTMTTAISRDIAHHKSTDYLIEISRSETSYKTIITKDFEGRAVMMHSCYSGLESSKTALIDKAREYISLHFK